MKIFEDEFCNGLDIDFYISWGNGNTDKVDYTFSQIDGAMQLSSQTDFLCDLVNVKKVSAGYVIKRTIKNVSSEFLSIKELKAQVCGLSFGENFKDDYFFCNENARIYGSLTIPIDYDRVNETNAKEFPNVKLDCTWADPSAVQERICASFYQPFPAILLSNYSVENGLVVGSLSQDVFFHNYIAKHNENNIILDIFSSFKAIDYRILKPNETLVDIFFIGLTDYAKDVNSCFKIYTDVLKDYLPTKNTSVNKNTLIWDSWNDGVYRDVSEDLLTKEAFALKNLFSNVEWLQLDDGYSSYCEENVDLDAHGLGVVFEGDKGIDENKFPNGLRAYADKIKKIGLRPSIWIGGLCPVKSDIYKTHPEWFIDYRYRISFSQPLDVSNGEVREYMVNALDKFFIEYGFEGVKHDFWSYAFEDSKPLYKNNDFSGYEYRKWWLKEIKKRLPDYGYMQTGCDISMGNPFLGEFFDNYRYGLDIGSGEWNRVKTTVFWGVATLCTHIGKWFIPNSDSIGYLSGLSDTDFNLLLNYVLITCSMVELSGLYSRENVSQTRLNMLKKVTENISNGANVYYAQYDYRLSGLNLPNVIYNKAEELSFLSSNIVLRVNVLNLQDVDKEIVFTPQNLGLDDSEYLLKDFWSGEEESFVCFNKKFSPHESKLYYVIKK